MEILCHGESMFEAFLFVLLVLIGPLAYFYGTDSRTGDTRGGWPGERRR
ncbi:MAG TPA: hypothetical protein VFW80_00310 [Gaiellaceae bacterium]|nr:hypothetical protein [Gaiellaceae bacterium]